MNLHHIVEDVLEAPALAWSMLAYYWGMSAFGLGPAYRDYMNSDQPQRDAAFNDDSNIEINHIPGLERRLTIKERFDRAVNFYHYCYAQGRSSSINPPFDAPPTVDDLIASRLRMEAKPSSPDKLITANVESLLGNYPGLHKLWSAGTKQKRQDRAQSYNDRVLECLQYVANEIKTLNQVTDDQLSETGYLIEGETGMRFNVTADLMDETMPQATQEAKFGECYLQPSSTGEPKLVLSGIFGAYYTMGHNLELAMFDEESTKRLTSTHHAILHTWRQLDAIYKENR